MKFIFQCPQTKFSWKTAPVFIYRFSMAGCTLSIRFEWLQRRLYGIENEEYLLSAPLQKKYSSSQSTALSFTSGSISSLYIILNSFIHF